MYTDWDQQPAITFKDAVDVLCTALPLVIGVEPKYRKLLFPVVDIAIFIWLVCKNRLCNSDPCVVMQYMTKSVYCFSIKWLIVSGIRQLKKNHHLTLVG